MKLRHLFPLFFLITPLLFSQEVTVPPAPSVVEPPYNSLFKTTYLDLSAIYNDLSTAVIEDLGPPPVEGTDDLKDDQYLRDHTYDEATKKQIYKAQLSVDSIFAYSYTLGDKFSADNLPKTKTLFDKVDNDVRLAIYIAKRFYGRGRPMHASGYCYPSGHSTRAFLWGVLLTEVFPDSQEELENQAKMKAWNRVLLGRHYPADIYAGKAFGNYLAQKLLESSAFQKEWTEVKREIKDCVGATPSIANIQAWANIVP